MKVFTILFVALFAISLVLVCYILVAPLAEDYPDYYGEDSPPDDSGENENSFSRVGSHSEEDPEDENRWYDF